jgi:transposase InsO family protein
MRLKPKEIIRRLKLNGGKIRKTAKELGISPGTVINWRTRARSIFYGKLQLKVNGLERKSTAPKTHLVKFTTAQQDAITSLRKQTGHCAEKIVTDLSLDCGHRAVHNFLKKKGLVNEWGSRRRPFYQETTHMNVKNTTKPGYLQMDVKYITPELSGLAHTCFLYAIIDIYSRFKLGIILPLLDQSYSIEAARKLIPQLPFKAVFIQTDNGLEFQERFHSCMLQELHLQHHHIHKSNPNENGVIERSFRTDEDEFFCFLPRRTKRARTMEELNDQYQQFLHFYNYDRYHLSLKLKGRMSKPIQIALSKA